jgi:hypothetical protein
MQPRFAIAAGVAWRLDRRGCARERRRACRGALDELARR